MHYYSNQHSFYYNWVKDNRVEMRSGRGMSFSYVSKSLGRNMACLIKLSGDRRVVDLGVGDAMTVAEVSERHRWRRHRVAVLTELEDEIKWVKSRAFCKENQKYHLGKSMETNTKDKFSSKRHWNQIGSVYPINPWSRGVWFAHATPKFSFLQWLVMKNRLALYGRMVLFRIKDRYIQLWSIHVSSIS